MDFNTILGAHERRGSYSSTRIIMEYFRSCSDIVNILFIYLLEELFIIGLIEGEQFIPLRKGR